MKHICCISGLAVIFLFFFSCKNTPNGYSSELDQKLEGFTKLSIEDMVRLSPIKLKKETAPLFFLEDGTSLNSIQFNEKGSIQSISSGVFC